MENFKHGLAVNCPDDGSCVLSEIQSEFEHANVPSWQCNLTVTASPIHP